MRFQPSQENVAGSSATREPVSQSVVDRITAMRRRNSEPTTTAKNPQSNIRVVGGIAGAGTGPSQDVLRPDAESFESELPTLPHTAAGTPETQRTSVTKSIPSIHLNGLADLDQHVNGNDNVSIKTRLATTSDSERHHVKSGKDVELNEDHDVVQGTGSGSVITSPVRRPVEDLTGQGKGKGKEKAEEINEGLLTVDGPKNSDESIVEIPVVEKTRDWAKDQTACRGRFSQKRSRVSERWGLQIQYFLKTLLLKKAIENAVRTGIILNELVVRLVAVGVSKGWHCRTMPHSDVPKEVIEAMLEKLEAHYYLPRNGDLNQRTFGKLVRIISWVAAETMDDLHALQCALSDTRRHKKYIIDFAQDWSQPLPEIFGAFQFSYEGNGTAKISFTTPLESLQNGQVQLCEGLKVNPVETAPNEAPNESPTPSPTAAFANALADFWYLGANVHLANRVRREKSTIHDLHALPYSNSDGTLPRMSEASRAAIKARALGINRAVKYNIDLLHAELSAEKRSALATPQKGTSVRPTPSTSVTDFKLQAQLEKSAKDLQARLQKQAQTDNANVARSVPFLEDAKVALDSDARDLEGLLSQTQMTDHDANMLLFYCSLRSHAWSKTWFGEPSKGVVKALVKSPRFVLGCMLNKRFKDPEHSAGSSQT